MTAGNCGPRTRSHSRRYTRRRLLAAVASGSIIGLAGCGYRPGAGDFDWKRSVGGVHLTPFGPSPNWNWFADGEVLLSVRNRSGRTFESGQWVDLHDARVTAFDSSGESVWYGEIDRQYDGQPAIDDDAVYVPLEESGVAAVSRGRGAHEAGETLWTSPDGEAPLSLTAGDGLVVGVREESLLVLDAETGETQFESSISAETVTVGDGHAWAATEETLTCFDRDGSVRVDVDLPGRIRWLTSIDSLIVVGVDADDGIRAIDTAGETRWTLEGDAGADAPTAVDDRLYVVSGGTLHAVDASSGTRAWERDSPFDTPFVAAEEGLYGVRTIGPRRDRECRLLAITEDGEDWWDVSTPADHECSGGLHLVGDRLVFADGRDLYAYYRTPGSRRSII